LVKLPVTFYCNCVKFIGCDAFRRCISDVASGKVEFYLTIHMEKMRFKLGGAPPPLSHIYLMTDSTSFHSFIPIMLYFNQTVDSGQWTVPSCSAVGISFMYLNPLWVQIPVGSTNFLSRPQNPDHFWALPRRFCSGVKHETSAQVWNGWTYTSTLTSSWHDA